jgi:hypothetical protein|tara:strand:- start:88 stop:729 length:642 start_codon:yes stop_codon:yes gene_type:complete
MLEIMPHENIDSPDVVLFLLSLVLIGLVVWVKHGFLREWRMARWVIKDVKRIWQRGADEVPQTEGIIISHFIGMMGMLGILSRLIDVSIAAGVVVCLFAIRQISGLILSWVLGYDQLSREHLSVDRHMKMWLGLSVAIYTMIVSLQPENSPLQHMGVFIAMWLFWVFFRMVRAFQTARKRFDSIMYSFLYLCALEILPIIVLTLLVSTYLASD